MRVIAEKFRKQYPSALVLFLILLSCGKNTASKSTQALTTTNTGSLTLSWDPSLWNNDGVTLDTSVQGYRVYYGARSGHYTESVDVGYTLRATLTKLPNSLLYFAVKSYNASKVESPFSNEVANDLSSRRIMVAANNLRALDAAPVGGNEEYQYEISPLECLSDPQRSLQIGAASNDVDYFTCSWSVADSDLDPFIVNASIDSAEGLSLGRIVLTQGEYRYTVFVNKVGSDALTQLKSQNQHRISVSIAAPRGHFSQESTILAALNTLQRRLPNIVVGSL